MGAFGKSFEESFKLGAQTGAASSLEMMKEKIKLESEKAKATNKLAAIKEGSLALREQIIQSGGDTKAIDPFIQGMSNIKDADTAELLFKSALATAEKQKSLSDQIIEMSKLAEAGKNLGSRSLFTSATNKASELLGQPLSSPESQNQAQPISFESTDTSEIKAPEIDPFTGKPTTSGLKQELQNKVIETKALEEIKGKTGDIAGRITLAQEAIKNIDDIKSILFPDGKASSFRRDVAFGGNVPGGQAPLIGSLIPDKVPFGKLGQDFHRKMGAALSARILIKTGVAARPEEVKSEFSQFAPEWSSNPESAFKGLDELRSFYTKFLDTVKSGDKGTKTFNVGGVTYNIPLDKVEAFKKAKGLK